MVVELKFDGSAEGAIAQVHKRNYPQLVQEFTDRLLLVGINYDKKSKKHECHIEKWENTLGVNFRSSAENFRSKRENLRSKKIDLIVDFCSVPRSLEEIAQHLKVSGKYYLKQQYIDPVLGTRLRMTEPDSPTSPTQKYVKI